MNENDPKNLPVPHETETTELIPAEDDLFLQIAKGIDERIQAFKTIIMQLTKISLSQDWVDMGGKPYLQGSGAERIAAPLGICWKALEEPKAHYREDGHYHVTVTVRLVWKGRYIEAIGMRQSWDPFFTTRYEWNPKTQKKDIRIVLPPSEIPIVDIKQAAITNGLANGITRMLGLRNLTWENLKEYGFTPEKSTRVDYGKKKPNGKTAEQSASKTQIKDPDEAATERQLNAIHTILEQMRITDDFAKHEIVSKILELPDTITSFSKLTKGNASDVIKALSKEVAK